MRLPPGDSTAAAFSAALRELLGKYAAGVKAKTGQRRRGHVLALAIRALENVLPSDVRVQLNRVGHGVDDPVLRNAEPREELGFAPAILINAYSNPPVQAGAVTVADTLVHTSFAAAMLAPVLNCTALVVPFVNKLR